MIPNPPKCMNHYYITNEAFRGIVYDLREFMKKDSSKVPIRKPIKGDSSMEMIICIGSNIYICVFWALKVILYSYLILKKMNERITDSYYCNKYT